MGPLVTSHVSRSCVIQEFEVAPSPAHLSTSRSGQKVNIQVWSEGEHSGRVRGKLACCVREPPEEISQFQVQAMALAGSWSVTNTATLWHWQNWNDYNTPCSSFQGSLKQDRHACRLDCLLNFSILAALASSISSCT